MAEPILIPAQPHSPEPQEKQSEPLPPNQGPPKEVKIFIKIIFKIFIGT